MRKYFIVIFIMSAAMVMAAGQYNTEHSRGISLELAGNAGYSSLGYRAQDVPDWKTSQSGSWSAGAHLGVNYFFLEYLGIGIGLDATRYGQQMAISGRQTWSRVGDTDYLNEAGLGEQYTHYTDLNNWHESQNSWFFEIPVALKFAYPVGKAYLIGEVGAKWGLPISSGFRAGGEITHTGYYEPWDLTLSEVEPHGFYTTKSYSPSGKVEGIGSKWSVFAKLGVAIPVAEHLDLTVQALGQYAITSVASAGGATEPGMLHDKAGMEQAHYFMTEYATLLGSRYVGGKMNPFHVGLELGIRYTFPIKHKCNYPCRLRLY